MKNVDILEDFEAHPHGKRELFVKGTKNLSVSDAFAELIVGKKHARYSEEQPEDEKPETKRSRK